MTAPSTAARPEDEPAALRDLLDQIADGNARAFAAFYDLTARRVFHVVQGVLRDPSQTEEVVQELYLEVWRRAPVPTRDISGWPLLVTIARRRAIDRVRASEASRRRDDRYFRLAVPDINEPEETADITLTFAPVAAAIRALPESQRTVLELAYLGGLSHSEIAAALDLPLGTVKTRLRDTMRALRTSFGGQTKRTPR